MVSIIAILAYVSIRFEYKMAVTGVVALMHDVIITLGLYALLGRELTPNTVAALLTIMGYSLYDTIVVFHRIRENTQNLSKKTFMAMANDSLNQVLARWINTGLASLIPVVCLLVIGGTTLQGLRVRAHGGPRLRRVLVDRCREPALRDVEGARAALPGARQEVSHRYLVGHPADASRS